MSSNETTNAAVIDRFRIEIRQRDRGFAVHVIGPTEDGRVASPMVWCGTSYQEAILASERYAQTTGVQVRDTVGHA